MDIAGHVSKQMLKHYSHIRMEAKRSALQAILPKQVKPAGNSTNCASEAKKPLALEIHVKEIPQVERMAHSWREKRSGKSLKGFGSSGRTRTYNPSVNSRMLYH